MVRSNSESVLTASKCQMTTKKAKHEKNKLLVEEPIAAWKVSYENAYLIFVTDATDGVRVIFLAGVNFYRFNGKNWHFRQILREKLAFFTDLTQKNCVFYRFKAKNWRFSV